MDRMEQSSSASPNVRNFELVRRVMLLVRVGMSQLAPRAWGARRVAVGTSLLSLSSRRALSGVNKSFLFSPKIDTRPQLILIGGCTGTGKSTFGMSVALEQVCGYFEMASSRRRMRPRVSFTTTTERHDDTRTSRHQNATTTMERHGDTPNDKGTSRRHQTVTTTATATAAATPTSGTLHRQGILKCISTDTVRAVMRSFISQEISPALHRSSYSAKGDPVVNWRECCTVLEGSVDGLVDDAIARGVSLVVEGVHIVPADYLLDRWRAAGGVACVRAAARARPALLPPRAKRAPSRGERGRGEGPFRKEQTPPLRLLSLTATTPAPSSLSALSSLERKPTPETHNPQPTTHNP